MPDVKITLGLGTCPACGGGGLLNGAVCATCGGIGVAAEYRGKTFTWGERMDTFGFALRSLREKTDVAVNLTAWFLAVVLSLFFVWHLLSLHLSEIFTLNFFRTPSLAVTGFWGAVLLICFTVYRGVRLSEKHKPIPAKSFEEIEIATTPVDPSTLKGTHLEAISGSFSPEAWRMLASAHQVAVNVKSGKVTPAHLFVGGFGANSVATLMWRLGVSFETLRPGIEKYLGNAEGGDPVFDEASYRALFDAYFSSYAQHRRLVDALSIFLAAVGESKELQEVLFEAGIDLEKLLNAAAWIRANDELRNWRQKFARAAAEKPTGPMNRAMTSVATPLLDRVSEDLTRSAAYGQLPMFVGRDREMTEMLRIMESGRQSVILMGPQGVGKDALIQALALRMVLEEVPDLLADKRLVQISIPKLVAGVSASDAESVLLRVLHEVGMSGNIILAVPNIHQMTGAGSAGGVDLAATFAAELEKGYFLCVGTSTSEEFGKSVEKTPLGALLQKVVVPEMSANDAIRVLEVQAGGIEYENGVFLSYGAVEAAVKLTDRYQHESPLPGKAIEVVREAALQVAKSRGKQQLVTSEDVAAIVSSKANVPVTQVTSQESAKLLDLEVQIAKRVIGQTDAVRAVSSALRRSRAELRSGKRPIGSFLFLGPTGVGKTELSKAVAAVYFGSEKSMIRLDMSEYQDPASVQRLLGVPGSGVGGVLTEAVRKQPYSLLLFDELEKADKNILNLFLQVMDDGRLTDVTGRTIDFTSAIIIMTSNAGTQFLQDEIAKGTTIEEIKKQLLETELKTIYRPEFLNRFDEVVVFRPLTLPEVTKIAELMVLEVGNRMEEKGIYFEATEEAIADLAKRGFDPLFGARPMRRLIQDTLENQIADLTLKGELRRGDTVVLEVGGKVHVEKKV